MFTRTWRFRPAAGMEPEFERVYGPAGAWAELFTVGRGYLGTELRRAADDPAEYLTIDHWESEDAWHAFRRDNAAAYEALDRRCAPLTVNEVLVAES